MPLSQDTLRFIREHRRDDVRSLALQARRYPSVDMPAAITQISGWQIAKEKIPAWAENEHILYPAHLSLEQCSSQTTAQYKAEIITNLLHTEQEHPAQNSTPASAGTFTDLTGGFGIDCAYLSSRFGHATYVERQETLCQIAAHNFPVLGLNHISVCIIRKSKFPQNPKRSVRFLGKGTKRSVQKRKARNTQKAETKVL